MQATPADFQPNEEVTKAFVELCHEVDCAHYWMERKVSPHDILDVYKAAFRFVAAVQNEGVFEPEAENGEAI